jgi:YhcH/YjgK/YiaL family protein
MIVCNTKDPQWQTLCRAFTIFENIDTWIMHNADKQQEEQYALQGDDAYVMIQRYETGDGANSKFESHRRYIDVHYIAEGEEVNGWERLDNLSPSTAYDADNDFQLFHVPSTYCKIRLQQGDMAIFFPEDGHMPRLYAQESDTVRKFMFKIDMKLYRL